MKGIQTDVHKPESFKTKPVISKRLEYSEKHVSFIEKHRMNFSSSDQIQQSSVLIIIQNGVQSKDGAHQILIDSVLRRKFQRVSKTSMENFSTTT